jgi:uncharacterized protein YndB with AHSA1/START domain
MTQTIVLIALGLLVLGVVAVLIYAATKPNTFRIQREAAIQAPPERIFPLINDLPSWRGWSPWEKMDPDMKRTYTGPTSGPGAGYEWDGNKKVGTGRMEITESVPPSRVVLRLDFLKPFEAHNTADFTLGGRGEATTVTWAMTGRQPFLFKLMTVFIDMDRMIGKDFEAGLSNLKALAEKEAADART